MVEKIQLPVQAADSIAQRLRVIQADPEQARGRSSVRLLDRQRALQATIDCGYDD